MLGVDERTTAADPAWRTAADTVALGLRALSMRAVRWLGLILTFSLFGYTILEPSWPRIVTASLFAVLVNLPLWWRAER